MSNVRLKWNGDELRENVRKAAARGLRDGAEHLLEEANKTVPFREGALARGGIPDVDEQALEASVSYGNNESAPYAVKQHEDTTLRHLPGRRAKWLELTLDEEQARIQRYIEDKIRAALRG